MPALVSAVNMPIASTLKHKSHAPAVQAVGSPPKEVHWAPELNTASRERTEREAWSFYWFETHCRECLQCRNPYDVYKRGEHLCEKGESLARDMALLVFMREGVIYERLADRHANPDRVEIPCGYFYLQGQLKVIEEKLEKRRRRRRRTHIVQADDDAERRSDERRRDDRYYSERVPEEKPRAEKRYEASRSTERAEIIVNTSRPAEKDHDEDHHRRSRRRHSSRYRHGEERSSTREKEYVREVKPDREKTYRQDDRYVKEKRYTKEKADESEVVNMSKEKKYRTEIRKPEKETRSGYHR